MITRILEKKNCPNVMASVPSSLPNWTGLLGWSTTYHDGTNPTKFGAMDEERKKWLETALNSAFGGQEDPNQVMKKAVQEISEGRVSAGLDLLDYASDFLDCAENFGKIGGLECVINLLKDENPELVKRAMEILTAYLPNNARLQLEASLKHDCLNQLKMVITSHPMNRETVAGAVSVIGSLIRNVTVLESSFIRDGGVEFLSELVTTDSDQRLTLKIVSLFFFLASRHDLTSKASIFNGNIRSIYTSESIDQTDIQFWETVSNFISLVNISKDTGICISKRIQWVSSLEAEAAADYNEEIAMLRLIVANR